MTKLQILEKSTKILQYLDSLYGSFLHRLQLFMLLMTHLRYTPALSEKATKTTAQEFEGELGLTLKSSILFDRHTSKCIGITFHVKQAALAMLRT